MRPAQIFSAILQLRRVCISKLKYIKVDSGFPSKEKLSRFVVKEYAIGENTDQRRSQVPTDKESKDISRRSFMKRTAIGGAGLLIATDILGSDLAASTPKSANPTMMGVPFEARERVRLGIIGVGGRGTEFAAGLTRN